MGYVAEHVEQLLARFLVELDRGRNLLGAPTMKPGCGPDLCRGSVRQSDKGVEVLAEMRRKGELLGDQIQHILFGLCVGEVGVKKMVSQRGGRILQNPARGKHEWTAQCWRAHRAGGISGSSRSGVSISVSLSLKVQNRAHCGEPQKSVHAGSGSSAQYQAAGHVASRESFDNLRKNWRSDRWCNSRRPVSGACRHTQCAGRRDGGHLVF